jgi:hypothetical protein
MERSILSCLRAFLCLILHLISLLPVLLLFNKRLEEGLIEKFLFRFLFRFFWLSLSFLLFFQLSCSLLISIISLRIENFDCIYEVVERFELILLCFWGSASTPRGWIWPRVVSCILLEWWIWFWWELRYLRTLIRHFWNFSNLFKVWIFDLTHHFVEVFSWGEINEILHKLLRGVVKVLFSYWKWLKFENCSINFK